MEAVEHGPEVGRADGDHQRQADGGIVGIAAPDPVPEAEHVVGVDAEALDFLVVGGHRHEVAGHGGLVLERGEAPFPGGVGVLEGLLGGEGLGADDEQGLGRVQPLGGLGEVGGVDIGDEAQVERSVAVVPERLVGHHRPQVRAADADIDHVADAFPGVPLPFTGADPVGEGRHPVQHGVHVGHHVPAVHQDALAAGRPQRHVQHRPPLGDVDPVAAEHGVDAFPEARGPRQLQQQPQGLVGDAVLGIVEIEPGVLDGEPLAAALVLGEQRAQVYVLDLVVVVGEALPCRQAGQAMSGDGRILLLQSARLSVTAMSPLATRTCPRSSRLMRPSTSATSGGLVLT